MRLPLFIRLWFVVDLALALLPPLHWWGGTSVPVLGVPLVLLYLFGSSTFIATSVVVAYLVDRSAPAGSAL